jgi:methyl acetate hydrolase
MEAKLKPLFEAAVADKKVPGIGAFLVDNKGNFLLKETFGTNNLDDPAAAQFDADTTLQVFSCTKLLTSIAALQLVEQGKLSLSDPVEKYVPRISKLQVIESFTSDDPPVPVLRDPTVKPTVLNLMTHTTGLSYDFFDDTTLQYRLHSGRPPAGYHTTGLWEEFETPLVADPGTKYVYGVNTDWLGFVVEAISGLSLTEYFDKHILGPLGMNETKAALIPGKERLVVHWNVDGKLAADPGTKLGENPLKYGGGGCLYSTLNDYAKLLSTILNGGTSPQTGGQILKSETITKYLFEDHIPPGVDKSLLGESGDTIPILSTAGRFMPGLSDAARGWSCGLLLNHEDLPYGRKAGSGAWAGLGNLYYWIDPSTNVAGMVGSAILPFFNPAVLGLFDQLERVAYGHDVARPEDRDEAEMNHRVGPSPAASREAKI